MEPSDIAYQGHDAYLFAGKSFLIHGKKMFDQINSTTVKGLFTDYTFLRSENGGVFENQNFHVFQPGQAITVDLMKNNLMK